MNKGINLEILLKEGFVPLEESKEGTLKGGFASLVSVTNNCDCDTIANNCRCNGNSCNVQYSDLNKNCECSGNNCSCKYYEETTTESTKILELPFI